MLLTRHHSITVTCFAFTTLRRRPKPFFDEWFAPLIEIFRKQEQTAEADKDQKAALSTLEQIDLGEWIAENESDTVTDYFIPTASYNEALRSNHSTFTG
jgi:hypothetical protein